MIAGELAMRGIGGASARAFARSEIRWSRARSCTKQRCYALGGWQAATTRKQVARSHALERGMSCALSQAMERLQVLVADSDPETLHAVRDAVAELGADVTTAATGDELLTALAYACFDVIVTDVSMPWMTGLQAAHAARSAGLATPIVVITASWDEKFAKQAATLGRAKLLHKPFEIEQLHAAIRWVLGDSAP